MHFKLSISAKNFIHSEHKIIDEDAPTIRRVYNLFRLF